MKHSEKNCTALTCSHNPSITTVRRAAIDIGSGAIKLAVADIDALSNHIVKVQYQSAKTLELGKYFAVSSDGNLNESAQLELIDTLKAMIKDAEEYKPQQWLGIGTSVFRKAANGGALLERLKKELNFSIHLLPQLEEAELGFLSGVAVSGLPCSDVTVWDAGSGSFQISSQIEGQLHMFGSEFGFVTALQKLFAFRKNQFCHKASINPISIEEASTLVQMIQQSLPSVPMWLSSNDKQFIAIGGILSIFSFTKIATGKFTYSQDHVRQAITGLCGGEDVDFSHFPSPKETLVRIILLYALMQHCGIEKVTYFPTNGACEGLLISPQYW